MHKAVKNLTDTGVNIKSGSNRGLFNFRDLTQSSMATQATMAESKRDCQCRGEWSGNFKNPSRSAIFHQVSYG